MYKKNEFELKARAAEYMYIHHYKSQLSSKIQFIHKKALPLLFCTFQNTS